MDDPPQGKEMEDKNISHGVSQPVVSATEAWLLSRAQALASLSELTSGITGQALVDEIRSLSEAAWTNYFQYADVPGSVQAQRHEIVAHLDPDTDIPVVIWPRSDDGRAGAWAFVDLGELEGLDLTMTAPFRQVAISRLPPDTKTFPLKDPRHSAAAAMVEVMASGRRDITAAFSAQDPVLAFRRLNRIIQVYRQAAQITMRQLQIDDFHTWDPKVPRSFSLAQAEALICQVGASARSHQVLAVHLMAGWLQNLADDKEINAEEDRKAALLSEVTAMLAKFTRTLEHYNRTACEEAGHAPDSCSVMVIFQPQEQPGPVLAIIPAGGAVVPLKPTSKAARKRRA